MTLNSTYLDKAMQTLAWLSAPITSSLSHIQSEHHWSPRTTCLKPTAQIASWRPLHISAPLQSQTLDGLAAVATFCVQALTITSLKITQVTSCLRTRQELFFPTTAGSVIIKPDVNSFHKSMVICVVKEEILLSCSTKASPLTSTQESCGLFT
jgi:hypothetical protein